MATLESSSDQTKQQNIKQVTIEKKTKGAYHCKSKTNDEAGAKMKQLIKEQKDKKQETIEIVSGIVSGIVDASLINETINEQTNKQTIKEKHEKILHDLRYAEGDQETRLMIQQEVYRLEKQ
ncbi:MAG: hypothetical protein EZS28_001388 [Streblomastix strix]|uniref:Uncharacterized protein n=1 Tax=Streblomastix strix TaxID=222440 RepID=A0A5J4X798_9EUKA|nr:MAG: hypothetical protein EZS28_001388 [Streblomastix strix]